MHGAKDAIILLLLLMKMVNKSKTHMYVLILLFDIYVSLKRKASYI
jgi:hypothetical protein